MSRRSDHFFRPVLESLETRVTPSTLPPGFTESVFASGLTGPTSMAFAPDGRLFVTEQGGTVRVVSNGTLQPTPFVSLDVQNFAELGLLGLAFDPDFVHNHYVYVQYTAKTPTVHNRVSRLTADGNVAVPGSEVVLLELDPQDGNPSHVGGALQFGLDGKLYVAVGDNGQTVKAQALDNVFGKILRINPDGTIPTDNPFYNTTEGINRAIWAYGFRNPFTFSVQPGTGRIFVDDVGEATWEEIDELVPGGNYGWPLYEGPVPATAAGIQAPLAVYHHGFGGDTGCAITGGTFYDPAAASFPASYVGSYFYVDYCYNWMKRYDPATGQVTDFATDLADFIVDLDVDAAGSLYYLSRGSGAVYQIADTTDQPPHVTLQPLDQKVADGEAVTFEASAAGSAPLTYQWLRDGVDIPGATAPTYTLPAAAPEDNGATFQCVVTNGLGADTTRPATLSVLTDRPPTATIDAPALGTFYRAGDTITFAGRALDGDGGDLPPGAFTWSVEWHTGAAVRPVIPPVTDATGGSFTVPTDVSYRRADVFYRITLTVRDASGLTYTTFRNVFPQTATLTLETNVSGLQLTLEGQPVTAPDAVLGVSGLLRTLGVISPQTVNDVTYVFSGWSDGGPTQRILETPDQDTTLTAVYYPSQIGDAAGPDEDQLLVAGLYRDLLGRDVDPSGLNTFAPALDRARQPVLQQTALNFLTSHEHRAELIRGFYFIHLRRPALDGEVNTWLGRLDAGLTLEQAESAIAGSEECFQRLGRDNGRWLDGLYQDVLGRSRQGDTPSQFWVTQLDRGLPRSSVAAAVLASDEARAIVIRDAFTKYLGRPARGSDLVFWLPYFHNPAPAGVATGEVFQALVLASDESFRQGGATSGGWLASLYTRVLDRDPDADGLQAHLATLLAQTAAVRQEVALALLNSDEYRAGFIARSFVQYLGRPATDTDVAVFLAEFRAGLTREQFLTTLLGSDEYFAKHGSDNTALLDQLYLDLLGRVRDQDGSQFFLDGLQAGVPRAEIVTMLLATAEHRRRTIDEMYQAVLRRPASAADVDAALAAYQAGIGDQDFLGAVLASAEYEQGPHASV